MRAVVVEGPGCDPRPGDFPEPIPNAGERLLELVGAGVHPVVRSKAAGQHYGSTEGFPQVPGMDAVARRQDGRLVYTGWIREPWGTMAQQMAARAALELPEGADPLAVAAGMNPAMSGWLPLRSRMDELGALGTVLVLGATGMAGGMAVQSALDLGADRVVAAGRDPGRLEWLGSLGAQPVSLTGDDPAAALAQGLAGSSPSLVLDYLWGSVAEAAFAALARRGLDDDTADIVYGEIGALAGLTAAVPAALLRSRRIRLVGSGAGSASTGQILAALPGPMARIGTGALAVPYDTYPISRAADAWAAAATGSGRRPVIVPD